MATEEDDDPPPPPPPDEGVGDGAVPTQANPMLSEAAAGLAHGGSAEVALDDAYRAPVSAGLAHGGSAEVALEDVFPAPSGGGGATTSSSSHAPPSASDDECERLRALVSQLEAARAADKVAPPTPPTQESRAQGRVARRVQTEERAASRSRDETRRATPHAHETIPRAPLLSHAGRA